LTVIKQLMARGEGLEKGTQKVLSGLDKPDLYLGGVRGLLSSYLEVEPEYVRAIEAALGFHLQTILVADVALASSIVDVLARDRLGEAVVLPENFLPSELTRLLSTLPEGSQAWAADKVKARQPVGPIIDHLLGNVLIVPDLEKALSLRTTFPDLAFATQNGEFVSSHGIIRGGRSTEEPTSMLQRQNEIKSLTVEVASGEQTLASLEATSATLGGMVAGFQEQLADAAHLLHQTKLEESELHGQLTLLRREMASHSSRIEHLQWEAEQVDQRRNTLTAGLVAIEGAIATAHRQAEAYKLRSGELDQALVDAARAESSSAEILNDMKRSVALERQAAE
jgi:chromosome segregation protein